MFKPWRENNPVTVVNFRQRASKAGYWDPIRNDLGHTISTLFYYGQFFQLADFNKAYEVFAHNPQPEHAKSRTLFCLGNPAVPAELWTAHVVGLGEGLDSETKTCQTTIDENNATDAVQLFDDIYNNISRYFRRTIDGNQGLSAVCQAFRLFPDAVKALRSSLSSQGRDDAFSGPLILPAPNFENEPVGRLSVKALNFGRAAIIAHPAVLHLIARFIDVYFLRGDVTDRYRGSLFICFLRLEHIPCYNTTISTNGDSSRRPGVCLPPQSWAYGIEEMHKRDSQKDIDRLLAFFEWFER
ncbi:hypothetical protein CCUS01_01593 [Colletotrichum cuscutae]|uniref:Uncharacterized protein n=1 Tax=Colletotrichum cuscutae TaxID=1209917 RepID=A0AAI9UNZ9_9PEZI|nr:hypothetical protein CCUS01_01593 [Colletotrichum cuscutae]